MEILPKLIIIMLMFCSFSQSVVCSRNEEYKHGGYCIIGNNQNHYSNNVIISLLSNLSSTSSKSKLEFFSTTQGDDELHPNNNKAYGYYFCRGDLNHKLCRDCVHSTIQLFSKDDTNQLMECIWVSGLQSSSPDNVSVADQCMVRFGTQSLSYNYDQDIVHHDVVSLRGLGAKGMIYEQYNKTLSMTFKGLVREAAFGNWSKPNFEMKVVNVMGFDEKIYTLVQCTPDMSSKNCSKCLGELFDYAVPFCCNGTKGGVVVHPNCLIKYNNVSFYVSACRGFMPSFCLHVLVLLLSLISFMYM